MRIVVTGAFSNIGAEVAARCLSRGHAVASLTNRRVSAGDDPRIARHALRFDADHLRRVLAGAEVLVNTYWIRFPHAGDTFEGAVANTRVLLDAAHAAGVRRVVQVTVSNPSLDSPYGYYRGKAQVEQDVRTSAMSHAIVRPTLVVGPRDVLTGNVAWFLRRLPVIAVPSGAGYHLQPVTIGDVGCLIVDQVESDEDAELDAAGPEVFTFAEYVRVVAAAIGRRPRLVPLGPRAMVAALRPVGLLLRDTVLTREELLALRDDLLLSHEPPRGNESVSAWLREHGADFGRRYANDTLTRWTQR